MQGQAGKQGPCVALRYSCLLIFLGGRRLSLCYSFGKKLQGQLLSARRAYLATLQTSNTVLRFKPITNISLCFIFAVPRRQAVDFSVCKRRTLAFSSFSSFPSSLEANDKLPPPPARSATQRSLFLRPPNFRPSHSDKGLFFPRHLLPGATTLYK